MKRRAPRGPAREQRFAVHGCDSRDHLSKSTLARAAPRGRARGRAITRLVVEDGPHGGQCGQGQQASQEDRSVLRLGGLRRSGRDAAGLLLGEFLPLHVRLDLLRHLGRADGAGPITASMVSLHPTEVDRVAAKRLFFAMRSVLLQWVGSPPGTSR
jgi:hypothetical protein